MDGRRERVAIDEDPALRGGSETMSIPDEIDPHAFAETGSIRRIASDVWRIVAPNPSPLTGPGTNTYVVGALRRIVIDPGPADPVHIQRILDVTGGAVGSILCTHSHPDHSPGAVPLRERVDAPVYGMPAPDDGYQDETYVPDRGLCHGDLIQDGEMRIRVLHTPGHASNHACLLLEASGLLFTGDHLMSGSTVVILPPDGSMRLYVESLRRLRAMPIADLAPGHGALIQGAHAEIDRVLAHRLLRESKVVAALEGHGTTTLEEILPVVYADVPRFMHPVAKFSLLAHAIKLLEEGRAVRDGEYWSWRG
jgi:glyoxylase-like metal-dependent hydrolase (beta-lactamase superfamily II)